MNEQAPEKRSRKIRRTMGFTLAVVVGVYLALCILARLTYPRMLFPAPQLAQQPSLAAYPNARLVMLGPKNEKVDEKTDATHVLEFPTPNSKRTVVLFHGNGETAFDNIDVAQKLNQRGLGVLLVEYRGYGTTYGMGAPPSEAMLYEDGERAIAHLKESSPGSPGLTNDQIVIWGWSLGSGVAAEMAHRGHGKRVVLLAPFTSITAMAQRFAPILPVSLLMSHRFDTLAKAPSIQQPTLVVHGEADEVIPFTMGERVASVLPKSTFVPVKGGHHTDLFDDPKMVDRIATHLLAD